MVKAVAYEQPEIGRHLIIARTRGMQPPGGRPDYIGQPRFNIQVNVFQCP
ncbi:MAG: hypothetical protein CM15mP55_3490 [Hyphomicrobiales bacterium]|nr:MAG: hypothetical protein CM15mP55_3490 [Hyphomicrobiales bacterium]